MTAAGLDIDCDPGGTGECIAAVRAFSRFYTRTLGLLEDGLLDTSFSLTEVRVIYEAAQQNELDVAELREVLGLDAGYLSRVLSRLSSKEVLTRERSKADRRRQVVRLTDYGRRLFAVFNQRANQQVADLIEGIGPDGRRRLTGALRAVEDLLASAAGEGDGSRAPVVLRPASSGDHGWVVERHGTLYAQEYGWDESFEALVARVVADHVDAHRQAPTRSQAWIAEVDGRRAGCVYCVEKDKTTAQLRLLLVEPWARGLGIGSRLVEECARFARRAGYRDLVLWTNDVLSDARRVYERAGFALVEEEPHNSFGQDLVGQIWRLGVAR